MQIQNFDVMVFLQSFWVWLQANPVPAMVGLLIIAAAYLVTELSKPFIPGGTPGSFEDSRRQAALAIIAIGSAVAIGVLMDRVYPQLSYGFLIGMTGAFLYDAVRFTRGGNELLRSSSWLIRQLVSWGIERITGRPSQPTRD